MSIFHEQTLQFAGAAYRRMLLALERYVVNFPNNSEARLELARIDALRKVEEAQAGK